LRLFSNQQQHKNWSGSPYFWRLAQLSCDIKADQSLENNCTQANFRMGFCWQIVQRINNESSLLWRCFALSEPWNISYNRIRSAKPDPALRTNHLQCAMLDRLSLLH
jgi:hypothetical protein